MLINCKGRNIKSPSALVALKSSTTQIATSNVYLVYIFLYIQVIVTNQITTRFGRQATEQGEFFKGIIVLLLFLSLLFKFIEVAFSLHCLLQFSIFYTLFYVLYIQDEEETTEISEGYVTVALGNTWSHNVNTRLILQYLDGEKRQVSIQL